MDARKQQAETATANIPAALAELAQRAADGDISGAIVLTMARDRSVRVQILGSAGDDRHRAAGLLLEMATGALRD